jgi:hypothetical protein
MKINEPQKGVVAITIKKENEFRKKDFTTVVFGLSFYLNQKPESSDIEFFNDFVFKNGSQLFKTTIKNLSKKRDSYFEISMVFERERIFKTALELYQFLQIVCGFNDFTKSVLGRRKYDGYNCDLSSENMEDVEDIFTKVYRNQLEPFTFQKTTINNNN